MKDMENMMVGDIDLRHLAYIQAVDCAVGAMKALPSDNVPGLWVIEGYPELTTGQLLQIAAQQLRQ